MASTAHTAMAKQTLAAMWPEDGESEVDEEGSLALAHEAFDFAAAAAIPVIARGLDDARPRRIVLGTGA